MKWSRKRTWLLLVSIAIIGWGFLLAWSRRPISVPKQWLARSPPVFGSRTNAGVVRPVVSFRVSNVGPGPVAFGVWWFECRAPSDRTLLTTNRLWPSEIPFSRGRSTNLTFYIRPTPKRNDNRLCCYEITWFERASGVPRLLEGL